MIIATRSLTLQNDNAEREILIDIHAPERADVDCICRFEIGWPKEKVARWGAGVDSVQALTSALQMIGAEIYTSAEHKSGRLMWLAPGRGYGFPVSENIRDLLEGDDKKYF